MARSDAPKTPPAPSRRRPVITGAELAVVLILVGCASGCTSSSASHRSRPGRATITRVVDGDTVEVRIADRLERVRLLGIDTPESVKPGTPPECFSHEASEATSRYLPPGTAVDLVRDVEARDDYGRLLAYVYRAVDHSFVNLWLAEQGYAGLLTYPPNVAHADQLRQAVARARQAGLGLWHTCGAVHTRR